MHTDPPEGPTEPLAPVGHVVELEIAIDQVTIVTPTEATATVRCLLGPVRLGARFDRIRGSTAVIDLELTQILAYRRPVEELDPVHTALVTLRGAGIQHLTCATPRTPWQVVRGTDPPPVSTIGP
ncbi:hypothetical protein [Kitasatospora purpeofusca]|uniref:hypothetical protein n=1 Tax=Kitasatospora purpeofusca TaxID=67352 RepID=UPI000A84304E|nr:hypothetical protein [Kitasatospora purpeofusca]MCX4758528.1 hypothetical protein [Kitasatospora purpeofusca]WSR31028.1 hypothetical protein OG715_08595 [Kitasatospora purpeofusca]WSR39062.1 hypothetical protein OG196_08100 [Kitasatospora purpeofusca]